MVGTAWHQRTFPYPLLASWTGDYADCTFGIDEPRATIHGGVGIEIDLSFKLTSAYLGDLIAEDKAHYAVAVSCPKTFAQTTYRMNGDKLLTLNAMDFSEEIYLTPYVVSSVDQQGFISSEHVQEWREYRPGGFTVPEAGILAVGNIVKVTIEQTGIHSVIDLVADSNVEKGQFHVELRDERIKIHVEPGDKESIEAIRQRRAIRDTSYAALFTSLYLSAVSEALREMSQHQHTRWAFAMRIALERCGVSDQSNLESISGQELRYAQMILENPMSGFLEAAVNVEDEV